MQWISTQLLNQAATSLHVPSKVCWPGWSSSSSVASKDSAELTCVSHWQGLWEYLNIYIFMWFVNCYRIHFWESIWPIPGSFFWGWGVAQYIYWLLCVFLSSFAVKSNTCCHVKSSWIRYSLPLHTTFIKKCGHFLRAWKSFFGL